VPTGESLDVLIRIGAYVAPPLAALGAWGIAKYVRSLHLEKELADTQKQKADAEGRLAEATRSFDASREAHLSRYDKLRSAYHEARDKFYQLKKLYVDLRDRLIAPEPPKPPEPDLAHRLTEVELERDEARLQVERLQQQIEQITRFDGRLWLREPIGPIPPFCPLTDRKPVIISVLNLKGGVGKTTVTANLAATLARPDSPALVIDLDYQRSLSMLLVDNKERILLHRGGLTIQRFLAGDDHGPASLTARVKDLGADVPNCWVLTNSDARAGGQPADSLEETENRLMIEWLLDRQRPDPRFFLREALHGPELDYGYVFLDCPPRLTTACVNALAASDFVLIPVVPDPVSTRAVENLLRTLARFRDELCPELAVLGVVPNMVRFNNQGEPIRDHSDALSELKAAVAEVWDRPFPIFEACIKHDSAFGKSAAQIDADGKVRLAIADAKIGPAFLALGKELEKEIRRHASRRPAAVPAKPGARARSGR
jgi:cellulose biosynthesis protein BcsQ